MPQHKPLFLSNALKLAVGNSVNVSAISQAQAETESGLWKVEVGTQ